MSFGESYAMCRWGSLMKCVAGESYAVSFRGVLCSVSLREVLCSVSLRGDLSSLSLRESYTVCL